MDLGLKDQVALVTGGSAGIGFAVAREFAREGARIAINSRSAERLTQARERIVHEFPEITVECIEGDLEIAAECERVVHEAERRLGSLAVLFTNAGGPPAGEFASLSPEQFELGLRRNLLSVVHLCRAAVPGMRSRGYGRVIALTSLAVRQPVPGLLLSNMARAGVQGFLKTLAREVAGEGVTVHNVLPGYTRTERLGELARHVAGEKGGTEDEVYRSWAESTPMGRLGEPEEIAALVAFLASSRASYMTGTAVAVDGGAIQGLL